jgi:hypothetical protein
LNTFLSGFLISIKKYCKIHEQLFVRIKMPRILYNEDSTELQNFRIREDQKGAYKKRRDVLRHTVELLAESESAYVSKAQANHARWSAGATQSSSEVQVLAGDWGAITQSLSQKTGKIFAVLNMANSFLPGGRYLEGTAAQEENMFRRTNCHYHVADEDMDTKKQHYRPAVTALINAEAGRVYLDHEHPRVCIKGPESSSGDGTGYETLGDEGYFLFFELKSAADNLKGHQPFKPDSMRKKIAAQLDTLIEKDVRHVVLSAFGCGAFGNPADKVAQIYREEIIKRCEHFDEIAFAIYNPGYGADNLKPFQAALHRLPLGHVAKGLLQSAVDGFKEKVNDSKWNKKGVAFFLLPFLKKTPAGIVELRDVLNSNLELRVKLQKIEDIARYRLAHPPKFTRRDPEVTRLYMDILNCRSNMATSYQTDTTSHQRMAALGGPADSPDVGNSAPVARTVATATPKKYPVTPDRLATSITPNHRL